MYFVQNPTSWMDNYRAVHEKMSETGYTNLEVVA